MSYQNEELKELNVELQELNNKLHKSIEKISEANRCKKLIASTKEDCDRLEKKWQELKEILEKEERDVEQLSKISFSNFLHTILNDKEEKLDKEKQEALTAKLQCDSLLSQLQQSKESLNYHMRKYDELKYAGKDYQILLKKKRDFILSYMPDKWEEIEKLIEENKIISNQLKEVNEAINAGNKAMSCINNATKALQSAENWGTLDMIGGGLLSTMAKRDKMSEAQSYITDMQKWINTFARELKDVDLSIDTDLELDSFLGFADYFFDSFFVDWAVQSKILSAQEKVKNTYNEVKSILSKLSTEENKLNTRKSKIHNEITIIIERV